MLLLIGLACLMAAPWSVTYVKYRLDVRHNRRLLRKDLEKRERLEAYNAKRVAGGLEPISYHVWTGTRPEGVQQRQPARIPAWAAALIIVPFAAGFLWLVSAPWPSGIANTVNVGAGRAPAPGYAWTNNSKSAVQWAPGRPYGVRWPHVIASVEEGEWEAAPGYEFTNDQVGDYTVRPVTSTRSR